MQQKIQKNIIVLNIIAFELVTKKLTITKGILVISSQCVNKHF